MAPDVPAAGLVEWFVCFEHRLLGKKNLFTRGEKCCFRREDAARRCSPRINANSFRGEASAGGGRWPLQPHHRSTDSDASVEPRDATFRDNINRTYDIRIIEDRGVFRRCGIRNALQTSSVCSTYLVSPSERCNSAIPACLYDSTPMQSVVIGGTWK